MGIFGSRKKIYVSSVVYNMAGDELDRPNFLKTGILNGVINNTPSISNSIVDSYLHGPGMKFRNFARWARTSGYTNALGLVTGHIRTGNSLDNAILAGEIPVTPGCSLEIQSSNIDSADYTYWADQFVSEFFPSRLSTDYVTDFDDVTGEIVITWEDTSETRFTPVGYDPSGSYIYATYIEISPDETMPVETGDTEELDPGDDFPDTTGWTLTSHTDDGLGEIHDVYERTTYMGQAPDRDATYNLREIMYQDTVGSDRSYRIDTEVTYLGSRSQIKVFIYQAGTGNPTLDAMFKEGNQMDYFFPFIPFRVDNKFVSETNLSSIYPLAKKGYKRATTGSFDKLIDELNDNEDLKDIDYTYVVFGVALNVLENASRKYIFRFFEEILNDTPGSEGGDFSAWESSWNAAKDSWDVWIEWSLAQSDDTNPLFGTPEPTKLPYPTMAASSIRVATNNPTVMNYDMTISWNSMSEIQGYGLLKPEAKVDEVWLSIGASQDYEEVIWGEVGGVFGPIQGNTTSTDELQINWQVTENTWRTIRVRGLKHKNMIYKGKAVEITALEAMQDSDESGFIIPLHEGIYRSMGIKDYTQMSTACSFMVFNCYQVVKKKWYQTGIFMIIVIIIIVVISIYFPPAGASAGGILGTNAAVGAALGFAGTAALVVGAIANAIAAMLLMKVITKAATVLFGEKWGAIIGAIASVIALNVGSAMASGQTMASSFSNLMRADNILKLTEAAGKGYMGYLNASTQSVLKEISEVTEKYEAEARQVREAWVNNIGTGRAELDIPAITDAFGVTTESMDAFLQRTLMTGSDVADMSLSMLTQFVEMTLSTELPT